MCGIAGYLQFNSPINDNLINNMLTSIRYRGPDDEGTYIDKNVALGVRRLSIIDLKTGHQPISNENKTIWVVLNGEIYNFKKLRQLLIRLGHTFRSETDTEVIVHLYEQYGSQFAKYLNGMFVIAIWDKNKKQLLLCRDQTGIKPLYVYERNNIIVFGSELKTILQYPHVRREIDERSVRLYSILGYVPEPLSIFRHISKIAPGTTVVHTNENKTTIKYWDVNKVKKPNATLDTLLQNSVGLQSIADVPLGIFLSGGIDSSLITFYLSKIRKDPIKTFSIAFEESSFDESNYFNLVASRLGTQHYSETFTSHDAVLLFPKIAELLDEPFADPSILPTFKLSKLARKHVTVALSGDGGDELFGGYPTYQAHAYGNMFAKLPHSVVYFLLNATSLLPKTDTNYNFREVANIFLKGSLLPSYERHLQWMGIDKGMHLFSNPYQLSKEEWFTSLTDKIRALPYNHTMQIQLIDYFTYLTDDLLVKVDRAAMYNSLEVRVPFLDPAIISYAVLNKEANFDLFTTKKLLRKLLTDKFPTSIVNRKKKGFGIPVGKWIRGPMKNNIYELLKNKELYVYFDKKTIFDTWKMHQSGQADFGKNLWMMSVFSSWLENWHAS